MRALAPQRILDVVHENPTPFQDLYRKLVDTRVFFIVVTLQNPPLPR